MKSLFTILLFAVTLILLVTECDKISPEDPIGISDKSFLDALIEQGVDANEDGSISYEEAESVTQLDLFEKGISDMTGIGAFTNLSILNCRENHISKLDVSKNTALVSLDCSSNQINYLNVTKNTSLELLRCQDNQMTSLDLSKNTNLEVLLSATTTVRLMFPVMIH